MSSHQFGFSAVCVQLAIQALDRCLNGIEGDDQFTGDLPHGEASSQQLRMGFSTP